MGSAKMPCSWQTEPETHQAIRKLPTRQATAALKLYIALYVRASDAERPGGAHRTVATDGGGGRPAPVTAVGHHRGSGEAPGGYHLKAYENARYWTRLLRAPLYGHPSAYQADLRDFMGFAGIARAEDFRIVTRAHVLAWRKTLEARAMPRRVAFVACSPQTHFSPRNPAHCRSMLAKILSISCNLYSKQRMNGKCAHRWMHS